MLLCSTVFLLSDCSKRLNVSGCDLFSEPQSEKTYPLTHLMITVAMETAHTSFLCCSFVQGVKGKFICDDWVLEESCPSVSQRCFRNWTVLQQKKMDVLVLMFSISGGTLQERTGTFPGTRGVGHFLEGPIRGAESPEQDTNWTLEGQKPENPQTWVSADSDLQIDSWTVISSGKSISFENQKSESLFDPQRTWRHLCYHGNTADLFISSTESRRQTNDSL